MKKFNYKVLEVNNIVEQVTGHSNCTYSSYTESCVIQDIETGEIINIDGKTANGRETQILEKVDNFDLIVGDEFNITTT